MAKIIIVFLLITLIAAARRSKPAVGKSGTSLLCQPVHAQEQESFKVASYNIQTGKNLKGQRNLFASAEVMKGADLVGVQEVYGPGFDSILGFRSGQTERLAEYGKFGYLFSATRRRWFREHRGNAILSKLLVTDWRVEMLPDQSGKSFRNMTVAEIYWQGQSFHFINTHLHTRGGREEQLERVLKEFSQYPRAILVGDFNSRGTATALAQALKDIEVTDAISQAGLDLQNDDRIDWILTKGFNVKAGEMLEKGISDHPYYQVDLSYS